MAYPEIDVPMYEPLLDTSQRPFPAQHPLASRQNTISLLETNQRFIEAYMVGLNHEFARELLWREYPDRPARQLLPPVLGRRRYLSTNACDAEALREKLLDIPPLHRWSRVSDLGDHDHREAGGEKRRTRLCWSSAASCSRNTQRPSCTRTAPSGRRDATGNRTDQAARARRQRRRRIVIKTPLYEAKIEPDIYFFGFDLALKRRKAAAAKTKTTSRAGSL